MSFSFSLPVLSFHSFGSGTIDRDGKGGFLEPSFKRMHALVRLGGQENSGILAEKKKFLMEYALRTNPGQKQIP